ncbi:MAG: hypothetical protein WBL21_13210 [Salinimicrobium sp.]
MVEYLLIALAGLSLVLVFVLIINNRKQRHEIKIHLENIEKLKKDSKNHLEFYE